LDPDCTFKRAGQTAGALVPVLRLDAAHESTRRGTSQAKKDLIFELTSRASLSIF
jgi:hypothetical protein